MARDGAGGEVFHGQILSERGWWFGGSSEVEGDDDDQTRVASVAVRVRVECRHSGRLGGCQEFAGGFTSTLVPPSECASPVGICTHGVLTGEIEGTYDFVMTVLDCPDADNPNHCTYSGDSIVTTDKGTIITVDTGVMRGAVLPFLAEFTTTAQFVSGTNRYKNASGVFVATGLLNFLNGEAVGEYSLQVCHGN